ncbi:Starch-binding associating with outer membrane [Sphingobacterium nematocida]|uniref:Starch-binding associating with outer membrane n=1 Tax=Sphingobacterium nematocida TaxID=1513896 RepID=A0A1T5D780_9SPHI|nr:RagB/SusD family nutrient uptake outer membrane protein [Sphingobacterium nematocida]SKB67648.1 Starch-binding associating with outer membrane [Sphingobacterium nematocida]
MKKLFLFYILIGGLLLQGCKDFLNLPPKNERAVTNLNDIKSVLAGYLDAFARSNTRPIVGPFPIILEQQNMMFEAYSDNFDFLANMPQYLHSTNSFAKEPFYADKLLFNDMETPKAIWTSYYQAIGFLNALIEQCDDLKDADSQELKRVKGEMLVHRAFYAFKLQQYFAPMNDEAMGIPLYLHTGKEVVGVEMRRLKQTEVYNIILADLEQALAYYGEAGSNPGYNRFFNTRYIQNLLAQVYWFKAASSAQQTDDYANAQQYALGAIEDVDTYIPKSLTAFMDVQANKDAQYPAVFMQSMAFNYVAAFYGNPYAQFGLSPANLKVADDLISLFDATDIRNDAYFNGSNISTGWPDGGPNGQKPIRIHLFAPEEAYLILAEAYYRNNKESEALQVLNKFKGFRGAAQKTNLSGDALLTEIVNERRKEFFTDTDKRWLDLKRYNIKTIQRTLRFFGKDYTVKVEPGDYHYALPIPQVELEENPYIVPNAGWNPIVF